MYKENMQCCLCEDDNSEETFSHLLQCFVVKQTLGNYVVDMTFDYIYQDLQKQQEAVTVWANILDMIEEKRPRKQIRSTYNRVPCTSAET